MVNYSRPLKEQLQLAEEALERIHNRSVYDEDLLVVLDRLTNVVRELAQYRWTNADEIEISTPV